MWFHFVSALTSIVLLQVAVDSCVYGQDQAASLPYQEAKRRDMEHWRKLLADGDYEELERISNVLRANPEKYSNGRGRDWRFYWTPLKDNHQLMNEDNYQSAFESVEGWLKATPDSVSARLMLAHLYHRYSFLARGGAFAAATPEEQLRVFEERNGKAKGYLDEIARNPADIDNVYRRIRIEISKGLGEKPDVQIVYDALKDDPLNVELVHGMSICLLPRWFGQPGELEEFAKEVVRRTEHACGAFQYLIAVMVAKEFLKEYVMLDHQFDVELIRQGVRDALRLYPHASEYHDEAAQLLYLAGDVEGAIKAVEKIGDNPTLANWKYAEINFDEFRRRVTRELLEGEQTQLIAGSTTPYLQLEIVGDDEALTTIDSSAGVRIYDFKTRQPQGWSYLQGLNGWSASFHHQSKLLAAGTFNNNSAHVYNLSTGQGGQIPMFKPAITTCFSKQGDRLAIGDGQGIITVHDLKTGQQAHRFAPERYRFLIAMAFSPKGDRLAATTRDGKLVTISLDEENGDPQTTTAISEHGLRSLAWSDRLIALGGWQGDVFLLNPETLEPVRKWAHESPAQIRALDFSPDGKLLAIGRNAENDNEPVKTPLLFWRIDEDDAPRPLNGHTFGVNVVRFSKSGDTVVSAGADWTIRFWKID